MSTKLDTNSENENVDIGEYQYGFHDPTDKYVFTGQKGLNAAVVAQISEMKNEPAWMRDFRLKSFEIFEQKPTPQWGGNLNEINYQDIHYFVRASEVGKMFLMIFVRLMIVWGSPKPRRNFSLV